MNLDNIVKVDSWTGLIEELYVDSWDDRISRFRSNYAFRGTSSSDHTLNTSLMRMGGPFKDLEFHLLRNFKKYARVEKSEGFSVWNWLVIAQHHGLPTRLLDWTFSPFVAMHFATCDIDSYNSDGSIWMVDYVRMHENLPDVLRKELDHEGANGFTVEMLANVAGSLQEFDNISEEDFALFFDPPSMDYRLINQYALHSVASSSVRRMEDILSKYPEIWRKVVIPREIKWEVRDKLDQANINERVLFPGLDGLCCWLARHYYPRK